MFLIFSNLQSNELIVEFYDDHTCITLVRLKKLFLRYENLNLS